ncbi:hypothetical protein [Psychrobacillus sp.]|uniref:hypothetical protein n=1 Tax=Psychrobacillus sp. TaxID=1871623 RepID=UPI0028BEF3FB|nr:hypothetical protein [Psychrobacillus sp.]
MLQNIIIITIVSVVVNWILSAIFKNEEKLDSGFVFTYYKLSYRRKMIRTLWMAPIIFLGLLALYRFADKSSNDVLILSIITLIIFLIQLTYTYTNWKKSE